MVEPSAAVGLGLHSAAIHGVFSCCNEDSEDYCAQSLDQYIPQFCRYCWSQVTMSAWTHQDDHEHHSEIVSLKVQTQEGNLAYAAPEAAVFSRMSAPTVHAVSCDPVAEVRTSWSLVHIRSTSCRCRQTCLFGHVLSREWWQLRGDYLSLEYGLLQLSSNPTDELAKEMTHDLEINFDKIAPFGKEDTGKELPDHAVENAGVAEIKRDIFRALTRLRVATIKEFDTIATLETQVIDACIVGQQHTAYSSDSKEGFCADVD